MAKSRILVVEDEMIIARDISMILRSLGYEVVGSARTGEQAIEMTEQLRPNLVLMDVHLASAMDGITASQTIRTRFDVPSVFLSAFTNSASLDRAKLAEPAGYLTKPFEKYELGSVVAAALQH